MTKKRLDGIGDGVAVQRISAEHFVGRCAAGKDDVGTVANESVGWNEWGPSPEA